MSTLTLIPTLILTPTPIFSCNEQPWSPPIVICMQNGHTEMRCPPQPALELCFIQVKGIPEVGVAVVRLG